MSAMNFCVASARSRERWRGVCGCAGRAVDALFMSFVVFWGLEAPLMPFVWGRVEELWRRGFMGMAELRVVVVEAEGGYAEGGLAEVREGL